MRRAPWPVSVPVLPATIWVPTSAGTPCLGSRAPTTSALLIKRSLAHSLLGHSCPPVRQALRTRRGCVTVHTVTSQSCKLLEGRGRVSAVDPRACCHHRAAQLQGALFPSTRSTFPTTGPSGAPSEQTPSPPADKQTALSKPEVGESLAAPAAGELCGHSVQTAHSGQRLKARAARPRECPGQAESTAEKGFLSPRAQVWRSLEVPGVEQGS